jgi:hypothetical protein
MKVKYVKSFKMFDGTDPSLTVGKIYESHTDYLDETGFGISDDDGNPHSFDRMDYRDSEGFCSGDHFEVVV